jgi:hypothetical protein
MPAAMAGVWAPWALPKLACREQKVSTVPIRYLPCSSVNVWRARARQRRASGTKRARNVALSRLQSVDASLRPPLFQIGACPFPGTPLLRILMLVTHP